MKLVALVTCGAALRCVRPGGLALLNIALASQRSFPLHPWRDSLRGTSLARKNPRPAESRSSGNTPILDDGPCYSFRKANGFTSGGSGGISPCTYWTY